MATTPGQQIKDLAVGRWLVLDKVPEGGSLVVRQLTTGAMFYWRHTEQGHTERLPIGLYDSSAPPKSLKPTSRGYSVQAARERARELAKENSSIPGGLRAARVIARSAQETKAEEQAARARQSLGALCAAYVAHLKQSEVRSWRAVELTFKNHLDSPFPELVTKRAADLEKRELVIVIRRAIEAGKVTTARKLRAYLHAAYSCAARADSDPSLPSVFIAFEVARNPVEAVSAVKGRADKSPLPADDLRRYWKALQGRDGAVGAALRLHVLSGGQRPEQLARITGDDIRGEVLRLLDEKGRRAEPRLHLLPITAAMRSELSILQALRREGDERREASGEAPALGLLLSTDGGKTSMHPTSLSAWASAIAIDASVTNFQLKRVRSGIETLLAAARIPKHVRGQLQSHGIGGVQDTHYDDHDYLPEKREALEELQRLLTVPDLLTAGDPGRLRSQFETSHSAESAEKTDNLALSAPKTTRKAPENRRKTGLLKQN